MGRALPDVTQQGCSQFIASSKFLGHLGTEPHVAQMFLLVAGMGTGTRF